MKINLDEGINSLDEKYKLAEPLSKKDILEKINMFLNDNKSFKPLLLQSFQVKGCLRLPNCYTTKISDGNVALNTHVMVKPNGERSIFRIDNYKANEINARMSINTLKTIYDEYVGNVGNYCNLLKRLRNLKNAVDEHKKVFFVKDSSKETVIQMIEGFSFNTLYDSISFLKTVFVLHHFLKPHLIKYDENIVRDLIEHQIIILGRLMSLKVMTKDELYEFLREKPIEKGNDLIKNIF